MSQTLRLRIMLSIVISAFLVSTVQPAFSNGAQETAQVAQPRRDAHVIMISIDGLVPDYYLSPASLGLKVPNLTRMKLGGAYAEGVEGIFPTVTYPAHTTMITGVRPAVHGIVQNRIFEPPTGKRTLQYATPGLLEKALTGGSGGDNSTDGRRTTISEFVINNYKPNLMLIHLVALDDVHHKNGPRTPPAIETTERLDGYVGRIIEATRKAGFFEQTTFFLVSDHG